MFAVVAIVGEFEKKNCKTMSRQNNRMVREVEPEKDWEDEYKRLKEQFIAQKQLMNEQEDHIKK